YYLGRRRSSWRRPPTPNSTPTAPWGAWPTSPRTVLPPGSMRPRQSIQRQGRPREPAARTRLPVLSAPKLMLPRKPTREQRTWLAPRRNRRLTSETPPTRRLLRQYRKPLQTPTPRPPLTRSFTLA